MRRTSFLWLIPVAMFSLAACGDGEGGGAPNGACAVDADCDDGDACSGVETCVEGACVAGDSITDGTECSVENRAGFCVTGACQVSTCGDGVVDEAAGEACDDQNADDADGCTAECLFTCTAAADCDDGQPCNGTETCVAHACVAGTTMADGAACAAGKECFDGLCVGASCGDGNLNTGEACDDGNLTPGDGCEADCTVTCTADADCDDQNACTADSCTPDFTCIHQPLDSDWDGVACAEDCDDQDAAVGVAPAWYVDCDEDGYARENSSPNYSCTKPEAPSSGCRGWTRTDPATAADCLEFNEDVHPDTTTFYSIPYEIPCDFGKCELSWDYDCDGVVEKKVPLAEPDAGGCTAVVVTPIGLECQGAAWWTGSTVPACGERAELNTCGGTAPVCGWETALAFQYCH